MSYDKPIGFGHQDPKKPLTLNFQEIEWIKRFDVGCIIHDVKNLLPQKSKEPEPKVFLRGASDLNKVRRLFQNAPNSFIIPGQLYTDDQPLVSLLLDTKRHSVPTCRLLSSGYSLRWRANFNTTTGQLAQPDFNEKSSAAISEVIGGCIDRDEREFAYPIYQSNETGYNQFLEKYREEGNPAFCDSVPFRQLYVYAGYMTARTMYGFAVKHPKYDFMVVFEACEDHTQTFAQDMHVTSAYKEFEFEPKQVVGQIPKFARDPDAFKQLLYGFMTAIQNHIVTHIKDADLNFKSKADMAREQLLHHTLVDESSLRVLGLGNRFKRHASFGASGEIDLIPERSALYLGQSLDDTISQKHRELGHMAGKLLREKRFKEGFVMPSQELIGVGKGIPPIAGDSLINHQGHYPVVH